MSDLIKKIANKNYDDAKSLFEERISNIVEKKMLENKKIVGAKLEQLSMTRKAFDGGSGARAEKLYRDVIEEAPEEIEEKYGKGYESPASKIEKAMKARGIEPNSSDKYREKMKELDAQYAKLKEKDKKLDEEEQSTSWANPSTWLQKFKQSRQAALDKAGITSQDYTDLAKNILPSAVKATADVVGKIAKEKGQDKNLETAIDKNLPVNAGTMTKHMMGLTTGIKDADRFTPDEKKSILDVTAKAHERSKGQKVKGATYYQTQNDKDYDDKEYSNVGKKGGMFGSNLKQMVGGTTDQGKSGAEYRVHTTLGGFGYNPTNKGLDVRDTYNFDDKSKGKEATSAYLKVRQAGEKADAKYADAPEKQQTKFTIPRGELEKHPYWSRVYAPTDRRAYQQPSASQAPAEPKNVKVSAMTQAKTSTASTPAYKAPAQPKAMTPATTKAPTTRERFNQAYKDAKTKGVKQFTFDNKPYAVNEEVELDEARIKIVKARVRGGKVQRRKKVSNVPGYTLRGGGLKRMSAIERRNRKMGQKRGKIKRRMKLARTLVKRQRSIRKRQSLGLQ